MESDFYSVFTLGLYYTKIDFETFFNHTHTNIKVLYFAEISNLKWVSSLTSLIMLMHGN